METLELLIIFVSGLVLAAIAGAGATVLFLRRTNVDADKIEILERGYNKADATTKQAIKIVTSILPILAVAAPTDDLKSAVSEATTLLHEISDGVPFQSKALTSSDSIERIG